MHKEKMLQKIQKEEKNSLQKLPKIQSYNKIDFTFTQKYKSQSFNIFGDNLRTPNL